MTPSDNLTPDSIVSRTENILFNKVGDEVVMLNLEKGHYHALDEIGGIIWEMIAEPVRLTDVCNSLLDIFDVSQEDCLRDVLSYLQQLQGRDLLKISLKEINA